MVKKLLLVWGLIGTGCCSGLLAQTTSAFDSAVVVWEKTCRCRFYYDPEQTKTLVLPQTIDDPATTLNTLFAGTGLKWFRDEQSRYFIYKGSLLSLGLAKNYFSKSTMLTEDSVRLPKEEEVSVSAEESNKVYTIGSKNNSLPTAVVTGAIRDAKSGEPVIAASVLLDGGAIGVSTDAYGAYSLTVPKGRHMLRVSSIGMKDIIRQIQVLGNGRLNIEMREEIRSLKTALVVAQKQSNIRGMQMGVERLNIKMIKNIPAVFGETDILKSLLTLPGITSVGEGTVGYNVRGGAADQNLLLLNDMTIYNPTHLFGFFSAVDPDVVRGLELYKSALPERYGGRLSSIMEVTSRDGNTKKLTGTLGIGPLTSKFSLEGPLGGEKTTFLVGGRATYSNWLLKEVPDRAYRNSKAYFYDLMVHVTHTFSEADRIFLSAYISNDEFRLNQDSTYRYSNQNIRLKWKHDYTSKFYQVISAGVDDYAYSLRGSNNPLDAFDLKFGVRQYGVKADFKYIPDNRHEVNFGAQHLLYQMQPGSIQPKDPASLITTKLIPKEQATETSVYLGDQFRITDQLSVQGGIRYTLYRFLGPYVLNQYVPGSPREETTVIGTEKFAKGKLVQSYQGPEIRASARWLFSEQTSVKISYHTIRQFIHMITNTSALSPTDIWKLSDAHIRPQVGQQLSVGLYLQPGKKGLEISLEGYYKTSRNYLDYKSGARLILNQNLEQDVFATAGKAYGIEAQVKRTQGKLNGWLSYTYLRSFLKSNDPLAGEVVNEGRYYPANFDKPHIVSLVANYKFTQRFSISLTGTYSTGRPITLPIATYTLAGAPRVYYSDRNAFRIPDFFRTDFSMVIENSHNQKKKFHGSWILGVYNITGRDNPYSVYFQQENGIIKGYQLSVFAVPIPFVSFNLKF